MISFSLVTGTIYGPPAEVEEFLRAIGVLISDKEMAEMAGVSESTIKRWKARPEFPRSETSRISRAAFTRFLLSMQNGPN